MRKREAHFKKPQSSQTGKEKKGWGAFEKDGLRTAVLCLCFFSFWPGGENDQRHAPSRGESRPTSIRAICAYSLENGSALEDHCLGKTDDRATVDGTACVQRASCV